jgi:hypothetical protein
VSKHPPYYPDLSPCDYSFIPNLKQQLDRKRLVTRGYFNSISVRGCTSDAADGTRGPPDILRDYFNGSKHFECVVVRVYTLFHGHFVRHNEI